MKALAVAALLVLPLTLLTVAEEADAATTRVLTISNTSANPQVPFGAFDGNPVKLFDLDKDGQLEIIAQNDNHWVYVFDSRTGAILAQVRTTLPSGWGARTFNGPEVAVFDTEGTTRLIVANSAAVVTSFHVDLAASTSSHIKLVKDWERRLTDCYTNPGADSKPVLVDLDKDGRYEIVVATEEKGIYALRDDGRLYWKNCMGGGNAEPTIGDLNQDGWPDVVYPSDGGVVSALNGRTGSFLWTYSILAHYDLHSGSMPVGVAIGQLDGLLGPDIVVGARDSHDAVNWTNDHAMLLALDSRGKLLWAYQDPQGNPLTYTHPIIADTDRDGKAEVYWGDWNTIGHKPPNNEADSWKTTGPAHYYRLDEKGNLVWRQTISTYWSNKDLALADVTGDGVQDLLVNGPGTGGDGIWYLDSRTGAKQTFVGTPGWKVARGAVVADLWGTGTTQWIVEVTPATNANQGGGLLVYDTGVPYNAMWPHLPDPQPLTQPPPPGAAFDATFRITNPNAWWQQVDVTPNPSRPIVNVQLRTAEGNWQGMTKNQWGAWTASVHAPAGTRVEFLATDASNGKSQSAPFTWLDGSMSKGSVTPGAPPPASFTPTFEPTRGVNEWWIEAKVRTAEPLAGVDARVNGGAWTALTHTSYDTWAKSIHAAAGSKVQFRATTTYGAVAVSENFTWLAPTSGSFTPVFEARSQTNNWWVEAKVTNGVIARVEARTNGGAWTDLPATSWGTWAKSYHVPSGSMIQFRATNDAGATALSTSYTWG